MNEGEKKYPRFSVLITVYKLEKPEFLDASLESVEKQTVLPSEIVLVEDGTLTKDLYNIIKKHSNLFSGVFKVIKLNENCGRGIASAIGLKYVSNNWVARVDSDDINCTNRFELQLDAILCDPEVSMISGQINEFEISPSNIVGKRKVPLAYSEIKKFVRYRSPINNPSVMFKKNDVNRVGGYPHLNVMEDYDLCIKFIVNNLKIINLGNVLVNMRVSTDMYSRRSGLKYVFQYTKLKNKWRKMGIGNWGTMVISDIAMLLNNLIPSSLRETIYKNILHKG